MSMSVTYSFLVPEDTNENVARQIRHFRIRCVFGIYERNYSQKNVFFMIKSFLYDILRYSLKRTNHVFCNQNSN